MEEASGRHGGKGSSRGFRGSSGCRPGLELLQTGESVCERARGHAGKGMEAGADKLALRRAEAGGIAALLELLEEAVVVSGLENASPPGTVVLSGRAVRPPGELVDPGDDAGASDPGEVDGAGDLEDGQAPGTDERVEVEAADGGEEVPDMGI